MAKILKQASRNNLNVAIIMDGNGRWALSNSLNISKGHQKGVQVVKDIVQESVQQKISSLTLYAFSSENWSRPKAEIEAIKKLENNQNNYWIAPQTLQIAQSIKAAGPAGVLIGSQNISDQDHGAFTGEISSDSLMELGGHFCLVGHSERREYQSETNSQLADKLQLCHAHQITPIFCCGESLPTRESGEQNSFVQTQLQESLFKLTPAQIAQTIIAYEPIWAIGTGLVPTVAEITEVHDALRAQLHAIFGAAGQEISILYGGSVKPSNAQEIFAITHVNGALVGGASLKAEDFLPIMRSLAES